MAGDELVVPDLNVTSGTRSQQGQTIWELCWGKAYPRESLVYEGVCYHFYDTLGPLVQFLPSLKPRILIREEYDLAYEYFEAEERQALGLSYLRLPNFILTGHPGIGTLLTALPGAFTMPTTQGLVCRKNYFHHTCPSATSAGQKSDCCPADAQLLHSVRRRRGAQIFPQPGLR
jgi:hypothetical protein